ncbi:hypothetical protein J6590_031418 [Homalodisca vitripennis]|nr:hypothetical protein J6590_031418 [Homalodisca vitripennis]
MRSREGFNAWTGRFLVGESPTHQGEHLSLTISVEVSETQNLKPTYIVLVNIHKCSDYRASSVPTFARTEPPDTQVTEIASFIRMREDITYQYIQEMYYSKFFVSTALVLGTIIPWQSAQYANDAADDALNTRCPSLSVHIVSVN